MPAGNKAPVEEMLQRWQAVDNAFFDLTVPEFQTHTSRSRDKRVPLDQILIAGKDNLKLVSAVRGDHCLRVK